MGKRNIRNKIVYSLTAFIFVAIYFEISWKHAHAQKLDNVTINYEVLNQVRAFSFLPQISNVTVNIAAIDDLNPMLTRPRFLMPTSALSSGRIVLTPPSGIDRINTQKNTIRLRNPLQKRSKITTAPNILIAAPAPAAVARPTQLTAKTSTPKNLNKTPLSSNKSPEVAKKTTNEPSKSPLGNEPKTTQTKAMQLAALTPDRMKNKNLKPISVLFETSKKELPDGSKKELDKLASTMKNDTGLRLKLLAYASNQGGSKSNVRRMSLSRALAMREYLLKQGVQSTKIEVRALGDKNNGGNPDRVDAIIESR